jgi:hypothetical protein
MRSSKGTAQFLIVALFILAALTYLSAKNADKHSTAPPARATTAAPAPAGDDDDN